MTAVEQAAAVAGLPAKTEVVEADDDFPDCVFVEDAAVVVGKKSSIM